MYSSRFTTLAILAVLLRDATALKVPDNQPDGVYSITINQAGQEEHTLLTNETDIASLPTARLQGPVSQAWPALPPGNEYCVQDYLWQNDFWGDDGAWNRFYNVVWWWQQFGDNENYPGQGYGYGGQAIYAKRGQALAYMCNNRWNSNGPGASSGYPRVGDWAEAVNRMLAKCTQGTDGWLQGAWANFNGRGETYGYTHPTKHFCKWDCQYQDGQTQCY